jgi:hypothetical protein
MENKDKNISRRTFLERLTLGAAAVAGYSLASCRSNNGDSTDTATSTSADTTPGEMTYRTSSTSGDRVSLLGYGCMRWPLSYNPETGESTIDQEAVNRLVDYAIAHGVNYFDTAPPYHKGQSEKATGIALSRYPRDSYFLATKLSTHSDTPEMRSLAGAREMFENSLRQLRTTYVDYYLIHCVGLGNVVLPETTQRHPDDPAGWQVMEERIIDNGVLDYLLELKRQGKIRNLGWSFHGDLDSFKYMLKLHDDGVVKWDFVQIQSNYVDWRHASGMNTNAEWLYDQLHSRSIPVVVMEPLLGGRLATLNDHLVAMLKQREPESSVASWAFRFAGHQDGVLTVLSGMTYMDHLEDNIATFSPLRPLSDSDMAMLEQAAEIILRYAIVPCTACQYCMPCPYGLDIPGIFSHYNKCVNEGDVVASAQDPDYRRARRKYLISYDRAIDPSRQANHCIGCGACKPHCPQSIDIPWQMTRIDNIVEQLKQDTL